jgi:hypothetical protein
MVDLLSRSVSGQGRPVCQHRAARFNSGTLSLFRPNHALADGPDNFRVLAAAVGLCLLFDPTLQIDWKA